MPHFKESLNEPLKWCVPCSLAARGYELIETADMIESGK